MKNYIIYLYFIGITLLGIVLPSCVDDKISPTPPEINDEIDPNLPEEIRNGFSVSFNMELGEMGSLGSNSRASASTTNAYLREIENFIDLERLRILFFVCVPDAGVGSNEEMEKNPNSFPKDNFKRNHTKDYFLFESKSRFVTPLTNNESTSARWQVTAPVFTYGNNDEYDWEAIRYALTHYNFKIAILVNRPSEVDFGDFDNKFGKPVVFYTDRGPNWSVEHTWIDPSFRNQEKYQGFSEDYWKYRPTINDLHHCQWDAVYSSKNNTKHVYDFIMANPYETDKVTNKDKNDLINKLTKPEDNAPEGSEIKKFDYRNLMGALSYWTEKRVFLETGEEENYYILPNASKGIPMYGVQKFIALGDAWIEGTPFNVSNHTNYNGDNIHLLRSLAKLELKIPKKMQIRENGEVTTVDIIVKNPYLRYSNVMARCEPLDVETPTEVIWSANENLCESNDIFKYGPIINSSNTNKTPKTDPYTYQEWVAWFYGAWKHWWHFNADREEMEKERDYKYKGVELYGNIQGLKDPGFFTAEHTKGLESPHIFNPVIQRNQYAHLDDCLIEDSEYWHYIVYTGERNINDPSDLLNHDNSKAEVAYFSFNVVCPKLGLTSLMTEEEINNAINGLSSSTKKDAFTTQVKEKYLKTEDESANKEKDMGKELCIPITNYKENVELKRTINNIQNYYKIPNPQPILDYWKYLNDNGTNSFFQGKMRTYAENMVLNTSEKSWNWPLLRNHLYSFTVTKFGNANDEGGISVQVVTSEDRIAPDLIYQ